MTHTHTHFNLVPERQLLNATCVLYMPKYMYAKHFAEVLI